MEERIKYLSITASAETIEMAHEFGYRVIFHTEDISPETVKEIECNCDACREAV